MEYRSATISHLGLTYSVLVTYQATGRSETGDYPLAGDLRNCKAREPETCQSGRVSLGLSIFYGIGVASRWVGNSRSQQFEFNLRVDDFKSLKLNSD